MMKAVSGPRPNNIITQPDKFPFNYVEAYKSLRTNIQFASIDQSVKKILITSSIPGEGKSTVAINLAITLASTGASVVIVDCDLRKPAISKYLRVHSKTMGGVTSILAKKAEISECTAYFNELKIYAIMSGPIPPNPAELLASKRMSEFIAELENQFDYIIIDTPPLSVVSDAAIMSKNADGVLLVIRHNYVKVDTALGVKRNLELAGARILGCILNAYNVKKSNKSGEYYAYQKYDYSYKS